jgi:hypothetical protein
MLQEMQPYGVPQLPDTSILYVSNGELSRMEDDKRRAEKEAEDRQTQSMIQGLAGHVRTCWEAARNAMDSDVKDRLFKCLRQRAGVHDPDIAAAIKEKGGSDVYMMLTDEKCTATESWIEDILLPPDDKPWGIKSTPVPDLPPEIIQEIAIRVQQQAQLFFARHGVMPTPEDVVAVTREIEAKAHTEMNKHARKELDKVEREIDDILQECTWKKALKDFLYYFVTFPVAYMKGPVLRMKPTLKWGPDGPIVEDTVVKEFDVPSPFDIYPLPGARTLNDGLIERHVLTRSDLYSLIETDAGYDEEAIRQVLSGGASTSWLWVEDSTRDILEGRQHKDTDPEDRFNALQFWGSVSGDNLMMWSGWDNSDVILDPDRAYEAEVWLIGNIVIKAALNPDPLGRKPYFKASFRELVGQFYGKALPEVIRDSQIVCNAAARNLVDNMAISSGPQVGVDASAMPPGEDYTKIFPWRVWPFDLHNAINQRQRDPVWFFQPTSLAAELMAVYDKFSQEADNKSGIPRYAYGGNQTGGPIGTATGFSMMMNNASRGIKKIVRNIDYGVIAPSIVRLYHWLMLYDEEFRANHHGDINIVARGSSALVVKEQEQMRSLELLQILINSPDLKSLAGIEGVGEVFRKTLRLLGFGIGQIIPSETELKIMNQAYQQIQMANMMGGGPAANVVPQSTSANVSSNRDFTNQPVNGRDVRAY